MNRKFFEVTEITLHDCKITYSSIDNIPGKKPGFYILRFTGEILSGNTDCLVMCVGGYYVTYVTSMDHNVEAIIQEINTNPPQISENLFFKSIAAAAGHETFK